MLSSVYLVEYTLHQNLMIEIHIRNFDLHITVPSPNLAFLCRNLDYKPYSIIPLSYRYHTMFSYHYHTIIIPSSYHYHTIIIPLSYHVFIPCFHTMFSYHVFIPLSYHYHTIIIPSSYHYHTIIIPLSYHYHTIIIPLSYHYHTIKNKNEFIRITETMMEIIHY